MPRRDGTGPMGEGSKTGRGLGLCNSVQLKEGELSPRGNGLGSGRGKGCRRGGQGCQQGRRQGGPRN